MLIMLTYVDYVDYVNLCLTSLLQGTNEKLLQQDSDNSAEDETRRLSESSFKNDLSRARWRTDQESGGAFRENPRHPQDLRIHH